MRETAGLRFQHDNDLHGVMFGDFRVAHPIASGGMATVYLGHRASVRGIVQPVAIKILHPHLATAEEFVRMFVDEASIASRIEHANVCSVLEYGSAHGTMFMAMQFLPGETLSDALKAEQRRAGVVRIAPGLVACLVAQACDGLQAAYETKDERGRPLHIVHRGVSPHKLHLGYDGSVHVLDFGVAKADGQSRSGETIVKGRYPYMAPEQIRGDAVDARADVWSLGVILRECASGKRLFRGRSASQIVTAVLHDPFPAWPVHVPDALRAIADRALQRDPAARYADTGEMGWELRRFLASAGSEHERELSRWMGKLFAARARQKSELLRDNEEESRSWPSGTSRRELELSEEPTRTSLDEELTTVRQASEPPPTTDTSQVSGSFSHIRPIESVRAALRQIDALNTTQAVVVVPQPKSSPLARRVGLYLALALFGLAVGWATARVVIQFMAPPTSVPLQLEQ